MGFQANLSGSPAAFFLLPVSEPPALQSVPGQRRAAIIRQVVVGSVGDWAARHAPQ